MSFFFPLPRFVFGTRRADHLNGSDRNDIIFGLQGDDVISALGGNDVVHADGGNDKIDAGAGNDTVLAGDGNDEIEGGAGSDLIEGGRGFDTALYAGHIGDHTISGPQGWFGRTWTVRAGDGSVDVLTGVEAIHFAADDYTLYLDGRNNAVLAGDDTAATGEDTVLSIDAADLTANDQEFDGDQLTVVGGFRNQRRRRIGNARQRPGLLRSRQSLPAPERRRDRDRHVHLYGRRRQRRHRHGDRDRDDIGVNDAAAISGNTSGWIIEAAGGDAGKPTATGALTADDVDNGDGFQAITDGTSNSGYGSYSIDANGAWTYTVDNGNAAVDALDEGETLTDSFTVRSEDGTEQEMSVIINGANDEIAPRLNEIHYDNAGTDTGEFVEVRVAAGADVTGMLVELYNGSGAGAGTTYASTALSGLTKTSDGTYDYYVWNRPVNGIQNDVDGVALSQNGNLIEFVSYEGTFTATNGAANGADLDQHRRQRGQQHRRGPVAAARRRPSGLVGRPHRANQGHRQSDRGTPASLLISEIQGSGTASLLVSQYVLVSAIVTYTRRGRLLPAGRGQRRRRQQRDLGGHLRLHRRRSQRRGRRPCRRQPARSWRASASPRSAASPTSSHSRPATRSRSSANITLSPDFANSLEQYEGMAIKLTSGTSDPLTVIENFNLDRFGEITVSAGIQVQPTQIYDPTTELDEIHALQQANLNNRLTIDDGSSAQNPDEYRYIPASAGDNGNGYLDAGDDFTAAGPTLRLGTEMTGPIEGVLTFNFGEYKMLVDGTLPIDEATNTGTREEEPADVGGRLTVSSFNLLNFFTTLNDGSGAGSGPNNLEPRGATSAFDLERQLDKIVGGDARDRRQRLRPAGAGEQRLRQRLGDLDADRCAERGGRARRDLRLRRPDRARLRRVHRHRRHHHRADLQDQRGQPRRQRHPGLQRARRPAAEPSGDRGDVRGDRNGRRVHRRRQPPEVEERHRHGRRRRPGRRAGRLQRDPHRSRAGTGRMAGGRQPDGYFAQNGITDIDLLIIGDLNSYAQEDPVDALRDAGYIDLIDQFIGQEDAFSFIFDGQTGSLDQGLASTSLAGQVTGVTEWHINSPEPGLLSYSSEFKDPRFYNDDVFGTSDHDPLIIGLNLGSDLVVT